MEEKQENLLVQVLGRLTGTIQEKVDHLGTSQSRLMSFLEAGYYCARFPAAVQLYCYQQSIAILSVDTQPHC